MLKRTIFLSLFVTAALFVAASAQGNGKEAKFTIRIENIERLLAGVIIRR